MRADLSLNRPRRARFSLYGFEICWTSHPVGEGSSVIELVEQGAALAEYGIEWLAQARGDRPSFGLLDGEYVYRFERAGDFVIPSDGRHVRVHPRVDAASWMLDVILARGIIPRILYLRGVACLHASAVMTSLGLVAFVGLSGAGKSTLAAAMVTRGFPLATDDVLPLRPKGNEVLAGPGLPELRLYPSAARRLGIAEQAVSPGERALKVVWRPGGGMVEEGVAPLRQVFLLRPRAPTSRSPAARRGPKMRPARAFVTLTGNSFWMHPDNTAALAREMPPIASAVLETPVRTLSFSFNRHSYDAVARLLERGPE